MRSIKSIKNTKAVLLLVAALFIFKCTCQATDHSSDQLLSLLKLSHKTATPDQVTSLLGKPVKVEDGKKRTYWYYDHDNTELVISWNKKSSQLEQFSFNNTLAEKSVYDIRTSKRLQSGVTNLTDALKILGVPKDMTIKEMTQEVHYAYQNNVLRLFFRDNMLVDYTLY